ncbi:MAG TPA: hypothetical protein VNB95_00310 [Nitrososphaera sp.]|nr:hypothetical protein [Nitrososphaera sp.]
MNMELIQVISAGVAFAASSIPLYFAIKVKHESQRILSSLLFVALLAYGFHSMLESFEIINYDFFAKVCFIISAFGLMVSYSIFQLKRSHALIGGIFGIAMMASFAVWMAGELFEAIVTTTTTTKEQVEEGEEGEEQRHRPDEIIDSVSSLVMSGFGVFLIFRFFWLRKAATLEAKL